MCLHALSLSNLHVLNISFPSLWPHSDLHPCAIIYLSCQSSPLEFTWACNVAGMLKAHMHKYTHTQIKQIRFHQKTTWWWEASREAADMRGRKKGESFLSSDITTDPSEGGMRCSRCGMAEKILEEHDVAKINSKAAVWKASLSLSLLNPYWHLKSNSRVQIRKNTSGPRLTSVSYHLCGKISYIKKSKMHSPSEKFCNLHLRPPYFL